MNDYEILLMLDPDVPEERHEEILTRTRELVEKAGTFERHQPWGRRRLAYEIDHRSEGVYHLLEFRCEAATLDEISRVLKITDGVMRHMATRRPRPKRSASTEQPAAQAAAPEPAAATAGDADGAGAADGEE